MTPPPESRLKAFQAGNRQRTVEKVESTIRAIEAEMSKHGYYPHNGGRVTSKELCRRAGIGESTLKNKTHAETVALVHRWLERLKKRAPTLKPEADDAKQQRIAALAAQVEQIAQHYHRFKLEYNALVEANARLEDENANLRRQLAERPLSIRKSGG
jgi:FtsZ-binding cell division protein ZapB